MPLKKSSWKIISTEEFDDWIESLEEDDQDHIVAALEVLERGGPGVRRPLVGAIENSRHANMRELRPGFLRILFAFDPNRDAILLIGGDKRNKWNAWYDEYIPIADDLLDAHLTRIEAENDAASPPSRQTKKKKGKRQ